jgi:hypothetical protein
MVRLASFLKVDTLTKFCPDDVWDEDSAYLELLASEVSQDVSANFETNLEWVFPRANVSVKNLRSL